MPSSPSSSSPRPRGARRAPSTVPPPIVTLTTDFGTRDSYVAEVKGVLLARCPGVGLVDVTHELAPQDILAGSIALERVLQVFPKGTIHVAVIDPGVGTDRRLLLATLNGQHVICPDNGLITWAWRRLSGERWARELTWRGAPASNTFHGRDVMAPAAGLLAAGEASVGGLSGPGLVEPILLDVQVAGRRPARGKVIHVDRFGNATTNVPVEHISDPPAKTVRVGRRKLGPVRRTYGEVAEGTPLALIGSSGLLEVAVRNGSAARGLGIEVGSGILIDY